MPEGGDWAKSYLQIRQRGVDRAKVLRAQAGLIGELLHLDSRVARPRAFFVVLPSGQEVVGIIDLVPFVEIDDPLHAILVAVGVGDGRERGENQRGRFGGDEHSLGSFGRSSWRQQHDVVGDVAGGGQVLLEQGGRHRQRFPGVVEASFVGRVDRELSRRADVDAGQIADGVVELRIAEPAGQHDARIAGIACRFLGPHRPQPGDDLGALGVGRLPGRVLGRHLPGLEPLQDRLPVAEVLEHVLERQIAAQIQLGLRLLVAVTFETVAIEDRLYFFCETLGENIRRLFFRGEGEVEGGPGLLVGI